MPNGTLSAVFSICRSDTGWNELFVRGEEMFGKKKSYLEQLREYCENAGITLELMLDYGTWYIEHDERRIGFSRNTEEAAKMALEELKKRDKKQSQTPHEDALKAWCKDMSYTFRDVNSCIYIPELSLWCIHFYYIDNREYACKFVLSKAKDVHDDERKAKQELEKFCRENGLTICNEYDHQVGVQKLDCEPEHRGYRWFGGSHCRFNRALLRLKDIKANKEWIWSVGPYERKVRELCERKGWSVCAGNVITDIRELRCRGIYSCKKGDEGFKEVWDNIQKLKELLC